jgi:hypothetical protein
MKKIIILLMAIGLVFALQTNSSAQKPKDKFEGKWQMIPEQDGNPYQFLTIKKIENGGYEFSQTKAKGKKDKWMGKYDKKSDMIYINLAGKDLIISYLEAKEHLSFRGKTDININFEMELEPKGAVKHK